MHTGCAQAMLGDFVIRRKTLEDEYTAAQAELAAHQVKAQAAEEDLVKFKKQVCSSPTLTPNSTRDKRKKAGWADVWIWMRCALARSSHRLRQCVRVCVWSGG